MKTYKTLLALVVTLCLLSSGCMQALDVQDDGGTPAKSDACPAPQSDAAPAPATCDAPAPDGTVCVTSDGHAGKCAGHVCVALDECAAGLSKCVLDDGAKVCVNEQIDSNHCGECGIVCRAQNSICVVGDCVCPAGLSFCYGDGTDPGASCVNLQNNPSDCGECGHVCPSNHTCTLGVCEPDPATCNDGIQNGGESAMDCGHVCSAKCGNGRTCLIPADCVSNYCDATGHCAAQPTGFCYGKSAGTLCRAATTTCDVAEYCDGVNSDCPADKFTQAGTSCHVVGDGTGTCSGSDSICRSAGICSAVSCPLGYICDPVAGTCVLPNEVTCHGAIGTYTVTSLVGATCHGWQKKTVINGQVVTPNVVLTPSNGVVTGGDGVCAITCEIAGATIEPIACSYVWVSGGATDVARYTSAGCCRMPDHPASEASQNGCTYDGRCDDFCPPGGSL